MTPITILNNSSLVASRFIGIQQAISDRPCSIRFVPQEILRSIFSCDVLSLKDLNSLKGVCRGFYQIFAKMNAEDSLGKLILRKFFPSIVPRINPQNPHTSTYMDQVFHIIKSYDAQKQSMLNKTKNARFDALLIGGAKNSCGLLTQMQQCIDYIDKSEGKLNEQIALFNLCEESDCIELQKFLSTYIDSILLNTSQTLREEVISLVGANYDGNDNTINPYSILGSILSSKSEDLAEQEKAIRCRLLILLGNGEKQGMIALFRDGNERLHSYLESMFNEASTIDHFLNANKKLLKLLTNEQSAIKNQLNCLVGSTFNGSDDSLAQDSELFQILNKLELLKTVFSSFSQESYDTFIQDANLPFEKITKG